MSSSPSNDSPCKQCADTLKQVLSSKASRPRLLLQALGLDPDRLQHDKECTLVIPPKTAITANHPVSSSAVSPPSNDSTPNNPVLAHSSTKHDNTAEPLKMECRPCAHYGPEQYARAFVKGPNPLSIVLCSNRLNASKDEMTEVLVHELVHIYDVTQLQLDLRHCTKLAYSEIRAAREGECQSSHAWWKPHCARRTGIVSTRNLFPQDGKDCVLQVFEQAYADQRPFVPNPTHSKKVESNQVEANSH